MCEDQVAGKRKGGVKGCKEGSGGGKRPQPDPECSGFNPRRPCQRLPDRSWGPRRHTLTLDLEITLRETACVHSLLMTDMTVKCDELVRSSVVHGLGCVKTEGNIFKTQKYHYTGATDHLCFIATDKIMSVTCWGASNYMIKMILFLS